MDRRAPPPPQQQPELQLPVVPVVRRRRSQRGPRQAAIPVAFPRPAALPVPTSAPRQIPAPAAAAAAADADADNLMFLAHIIVSHVDAEAEASSRHIPAPPAPAGEKRPRRYSPPLAPPAAAADEEKEKPYNAPPLPALAVDEPQSSLSVGHGHGDGAGTKASAEDCMEAACPQGNAAGSSNGDQHGGGAASPLPAAGAGAGASPMQLGDDDVDDEDLEPGEIPPEKPAAGYDADPAAHGSLLAAGKEVEMTAWDEEAAKTTIAGEPAATTGSSAHRRAVPTVVVGKDDGGRTGAEISAEEEKRKKEVFIGGLSRDAVEDDVRAALSAAGEITQVRMFMDRFTGKNKGYCFVAYSDAAMASKAVAEFGDVKICGKPCRVAVPEGIETKPKIAQRDPTTEDYNRIYEQRQPSPTLAAQSSYITSWDHHASYVVPPPVVAGYYYPMYHNGNIVYLPPPDLNRRDGLLGSGPSGRSQMGQSGSSRPPAGPPHRSRN